MTRIVTVRSVRNPEITRKMSLDLALRNSSRWQVMDEESFHYPCPDPVIEPVPDGVKIVVAVIVFDRLKNIEEWIRCWKKSITDNAELVIIHNHRSLSVKNTYQSLCVNNGITYVPRENKGFDIGAFQDVCNYRLRYFPTDFDYLLWCTDDLLPQRKTFIQEYYSASRRGTVACYEISNEVNPHIRTTGFMIPERYLYKIQFNFDPILTKSQCYEFEHRDKENSFTDQVRRFGRAVQVCDVECSPMWDTGHRSKEAKLRFARREREHKTNFK